MCILLVRVCEHIVKLSRSVSVYLCLRKKLVLVNNKTFNKQIKRPFLQPFFTEIIILHASLLRLPSKFPSYLHIIASSKSCIYRTPKEKRKHSSEISFRFIALVIGSVTFPSSDRIRVRGALLTMEFIMVGRKYVKLLQVCLTMPAGSLIRG